MSNDNTSVKECWQNDASTSGTDEVHTHALENISAVKSEDDSARVNESKESICNNQAEEANSTQPWLLPADQRESQELREELNTSSQAPCSLRTHLCYIPVETVLKEDDGEVSVSSRESESVSKENQKELSTEMYELPSDGTSKDCWRNNISSCGTEALQTVILENISGTKPEDNASGITRGNESRDGICNSQIEEVGATQRWLLVRDQRKLQELRGHLNSTSQSTCNIGSQLGADTLFSHIPVETVLKEDDGEVTVSSRESDSASKENNQKELTSTDLYELPSDNTSKDCWRTSISSCSTESLQAVTCKSDGDEEEKQDSEDGKVHALAPPGTFWIPQEQLRHHQDLRLQLKSLIQSGCNIGPQMTNENLYIQASDCKTRQKLKIQHKRQDPYYKEQERLRQRSMMQLKRQDPLFRALEREKERHRMRNRRMDPLFRAQERERQRRRMQLKRRDPVFRQRERDRQKNRMQIRRLNPRYKEQERVRDRIRMRIRRQVDGYKILTSKVEDSNMRSIPSNSENCLAHSVKDSCTCESCNTSVLSVEHSVVPGFGIPAANRANLKDDGGTSTQKDDKGRSELEMLGYNSPYPILFNFYSTGKELPSSPPNSVKMESKAVSVSKINSVVPSIANASNFSPRNPVPIPSENNAADRIPGFMAGHFPFTSNNPSKQQYSPSESSTEACPRVINTLPQPTQASCQPAGPGVQKNISVQSNSCIPVNNNEQQASTTTTICQSNDNHILMTNPVATTCMTISRTQTSQMSHNTSTKGQENNLGMDTRFCDIGGIQRSTTELCRITMTTDALSWTPLWATQSGICECAKCRAVPKCLDMQLQLHHKENIRHTQNAGQCWAVKRSKVNEKPYLCNQCGAQLQTMSGLRYHEQTHSTDLSYRCDSCGKAYNNRGNLVRHLKLHTERYHCDMCGKVFHMKQHLKEHMRSHGDKNLSCPHCDYKTCYKYALNRHLATKHGSDECLSCSCGLQFKTQHLLERHQMVCRAVQLHHQPSVAVMSVSH